MRCWSTRTTSRSGGAARPPRSTRACSNNLDRPPAGDGRGLRPGRALPVPVLRRAGATRRTTWRATRSALRRPQLAFTDAKTLVPGHRVPARPRPRAPLFFRDVDASVGRAVARQRDLLDADRRRATAGSCRDLFGVPLGGGHVLGTGDPADGRPPAVDGSDPGHDRGPLARREGAGAAAARPQQQGDRQDPAGTLRAARARPRRRRSPACVKPSRRRTARAGRFSANVEAARRATPCSSACRDEPAREQRRDALALPRVDDEERDVGGARAAGLGRVAGDADDRRRPPGRSPRTRRARAGRCRSGRSAPRRLSRGLGPRKRQLARALAHAPERGGEAVAVGRRVSGRTASGIAVRGVSWVSGAAMSR